MTFLDKNILIPNQIFIYKCRQMFKEKSLKRVLYIHNLWYVFKKQNAKFRDMSIFPRCRSLLQCLFFTNWRKILPQYGNFHCIFVLFLEYRVSFSYISRLISVNIILYMYMKGNGYGMALFEGFYGRYTYIYICLFDCHIILRKYYTTARTKSFELQQFESFRPTLIIFRFQNTTEKYLLYSHNFYS